MPSQTSHRGSGTERTLTLMFTDLVASTEFAERRGDREAHQLILEQRGLVREHVARLGGREVDTAGDGFFIVFESARSALQCAFSIQRGASELSTKELQIRIGLHSGDVLETAQDVSGTAVNGAARIAAVARPTQILVSEVVKMLVGPTAGASFADAGEQRLKGLSDRLQLYDVRPKDLLTIAVAEDNVLVREGIAMILRAQQDMRLVASCADLESIERAVDEMHPDVVITDVRMPPTKTSEGYELARALRTTHPRVGVIVLSQYGEPGLIKELLEPCQGGRAFLLKESVASPEAVMNAIRVVAEGGRLVDPTLGVENG